MESKEDYAELECEEFPDEFQCCVCLDIMYKPVVLACGHISCFWCVFKAMETFRESHCPVCRSPYNHFPRICKLLHFLLLKFYPAAYARRGRQVAEEEKECGHASPQFDDTLIDSDSHELTDVQDTSSPLLKAATVEPEAKHGSDDSSVRDSLEKPFPGEDNVDSIPTTLKSQITSYQSRHENYLVAQNDTNEILKLFPVSVFECAVCKNLLYRPVVLNCGHVYCEACINSQHDNVCRCPGCQCPHPNGFPNVCLVLEHFLEKHFPTEHSARGESVAKVQRASTSGCLTENQGHAGKQSKVPTDVYSSWWSSPSFNGPKVHPGVGCDYCGMSPIIGERYRCKDCVEKIGFDLCEGCYDSSSKLPGRFNQQHTQDHKFVIVEPYYLRDLILSLGAEEYEGSDIAGSNPDNLEVVFRVPSYSNDAFEDQVETPTSLQSSDDGPDDLQDEMAFQDPLNHPSDDQGDHET
ncbi:E3 ubiquitin-protein ligase PRT1-like [Primulina huaijiensis]|uniref:E3 ubiquitin-protein ligase PRT1-like n=1 Tax=Primulina huaijiensis TaxID=1492673 RepID=UPI003CC774D7